LPVIEVDEVLVTCRDPDPAKIPADHVISLQPVEVTWYKAMQCSGVSYLVQRSWHGSDIAGSVLGSAAVLDAWKHWITAVTLRREVHRAGVPAPLAGPPI
jgi:hypothetical protein